MRKKKEPNLPLNRHFGAFFIEELIAKGGMAEIYRARVNREILASTGLKKQSQVIPDVVALKVLHREFASDHLVVQMLANEAKITTQLNHQHIARTFDLGKVGHSHYLAMEYVNGPDCFSLFKKLSELKRQIPIHSVLYVIRAILDALSYAHQYANQDGPLNIIHRDVSPQNILLRRDGEVKLIDFGIAKATNLSMRTRSGVIKGKLVYMSPEQSWGQKLDQRTDIYSAGVVLYEGLTGGSLYLESNPAKLLEMVRKAEIPPPSRLNSQIDAQLDAIVMRALSAHREIRFQSADEFANAIDSYCANLTYHYSPSDLANLVDFAFPLKIEPPELNRHSLSEGLGKEPQGRDKIEQRSLIFSGDDILPGKNPRAWSERKRKLSQDGAMSAQLMLIKQDGNETFPIEQQFVIGRGGDLRLNDGRVSRQHARIFNEGENYLLEDLKSSNGTYLNDVRIEGVMHLENEDHIRIGPFHMQFFLVDEADTNVQQHRPSQGVPSVGKQKLPIPPVAPPAAPSVAAPSVTPPASALPVAPPASAPSVTPPTAPKKPAPAFSPPSAPKAPSSVFPSVASQRSPSSVFPATGDSNKHKQPPAPISLSDDAMLETARQNLACLRVILGDEVLTIPIPRRLPLGQKISLSEHQFDGPAGVIVRRGDAHWIEPQNERDAVLLNGQEVKRPIQLKMGDTLMIGELRAEFGIE